MYEYVTQKKKRMELFFLEAIKIQFKSIYISYNYFVHFSSTFENLYRNFIFFISDD